MKPVNKLSLWLSFVCSLSTCEAPSGRTIATANQGSKSQHPKDDHIKSLIETLHQLNNNNTNQSQHDAAVEVFNNIERMSDVIPEDIRNAFGSLLFNITYTERNISAIDTLIDKLYERISPTLSQSINYTEFRYRDTDEQSLFRSLMINYEKSVRPVFNALDPINLRIGITLNQLDVDEKNQVLTALVWLDQEWHDEKMLWNPSDYNNLTVLRVPCDFLWLPDIVLYNSVEDLRIGYMKALSMVSHDGVVFWPPIVRYHGNCEILIRYFPFDDQVCKLKLGSWGYDGSQLNVTKRRDGIDLSNYTPNGEWKLMRTQVIRNVRYYPCCVQPFIDITFVIYLQRRILYYAYNIMIPCIMLSILTLLSFWMKPDSGEKITLGLTILLAFSVFMLLIAESMPSTGVNVPIIGVYITTSMCITAFSVVVAVMVSNVNTKADGDVDVPYWIHKICFILSKAMCVKMRSWEERHCGIRKLTPAAIVKGGMIPCKKNEENGVDTHIHTGGLKASAKLPPDIEAGEKTKLHTRTHGKKLQRAGGEDSLLKRLHSIIEHQEAILHKQTKSDDWHNVAVILDRFLFWLYLAMMLSTTIGCLVIFPSTKDSIAGEGELNDPL